MHGLLGRAERPMPRGSVLAVSSRRGAPWWGRDARVSSGARERPRLRRAGPGGQRLAVMENLEGVACEQLVLGGVGAHFHAKTPAAVEQPEREAREPGRELRCEGERVAVVAHAAEAGDGRE